MPERIADQDRVDAGVIEQARHRRVVRGQHGDLLAARFFSLRSGTRILEGAHGRLRRLHRIAANVFVSHAVSASLTSLLTLRSVSEAYSLTSPVMAGTSR